MTNLPKYSKLEENDETERQNQGAAERREGGEVLTFLFASHSRSQRRLGPKALANSECTLSLFFGGEGGDVKKILSP